ncbi:anti-sigma factor family protein [Kribbella sp. CA-293567]|uniref:anti-sigma factor family protein n=1 Tax=Kribbella sp. CA-293567 TaxID=3002436 RepID=UPI0022DDFB8D|nr:hypothetical protein [Kribbella sp. CA-293567]WBQ03838.1 hypothetical protein OX958_28190 [Kribbella sp. CA-293567]
MKNLNDSLPELMRRATENLEPESTDLVERGMARGATLRRRRTALVSVSGAAAVLATAGIIVSGSQLFAKDTQPPAAGTTDKQTIRKTSGVAAKPPTRQETLNTLIELVPARFKVTKPETWGDDWGQGASVLINDGKGLSRLQVSVSAPGVDGNCFDPEPGTCLPRPDGSRVLIRKEEPTYQPDNNPGGVLANAVGVIRRGTESVSLYNFNAVQEKQTEKTRAKPALTIAELTAMADSKLWRFLPKPLPEPSGPVKPEPTSPGTSKPPVPVQETLQTLKQVLPKSLQVSQPGTWGGAPDDFNGAYYLVNDGKGLSRVEAFVSYEVPVAKKCTDERATTFCKVRPDGAVVGWSKNSPEYGDARQKKDGVLANTAEIHYPDGRFITLTSYNAVEQKGSRHTRPKPAVTAEQLLAMAGNKAWKFPGGKK